MWLYIFLTPVKSEKLVSFNYNVHTQNTCKHYNTKNMKYFILLNHIGSILYIGVHLSNTSMMYIYTNYYFIFYSTLYQVWYGFQVKDRFDGLIIKI